jgi:hypothetical protein
MRYLRNTSAALSYKVQPIAIRRPYSHSTRRTADSKKVTADGIFALVVLAISLVVLCCIYIPIGGAATCSCKATTIPQTGFVAARGFRLKSTLSYHTNFIDSRRKVAENTKLLFFTTFFVSLIFLFSFILLSSFCFETFSLPSVSALHQLPYIIFSASSHFSILLSSAFNSSFSRALFLSPRCASFYFSCFDLFYSFRALIIVLTIVDFRFQD